MEELILLSTLLLFLALPVTALALFINLFKKNREVSRLAESTQKLLGALQSQVDALEKRVGGLEGRQVILEEPAAVAEPEPHPEPPPEPKLEPMEEGPAVPRAAVPSPPVAQQEETKSVAARKGAEVERQFGTKVAVWIGAAALALSGAFLVKYSFEQGLIGPTTRVILGLVFGLALLCLAEWMYQRVAGVARGLAAAGIAVLYAALLAGVRLYELIPPMAGFAGMALTTAAAVVLALRHGQIVAILGLLGGFLTPIMISTGEQHPWQLLFYLVLLQTGLLIVSRRRLWWPIAGLTLAGTMGWAVLWMADLATIGGDSLHIGLLLIVAILSFVAAAFYSGRADGLSDGKFPLILGWGGAGLGVILLAALVGVGDFGLLEWAFLGIVGAGCIVLGCKVPHYEGLAWLASIAGAGMLLLWGTTLDPAQHLRLWSVAALYATLYVGGAYVAMWRGAAPERWASLAAVSGVFYLLAAYAGLRNIDVVVPWGVQALVMSAIFTGLAIPVARRRHALTGGNVALAALAVAVTALVSLAVPMELERAWITVAWAVEVPALAWVAIRLRVPELEKLAWIMAALVAARLLLNPEIPGYPIGEGLLFNWLLYGYGVPIVAFVVGAMLFRGMDRGGFADVLEVGAMVFGFVLLALEVRQYFHPGDLYEADFMFAEWGAFTVVWLLYGLALLALFRITDRRIHLVAGSAVGMVALAQGLSVQVLFSSPLIIGHDVGGTLIWNKLLFVYGVPAILALLLARSFGRFNLRTPSIVAGSAALIFGMITMSLEVRQAFHGNLLNHGPTSNAEMYTYSLVWVLFAIALLVAGIVTRGVVLRYGSALVMALAVCKVFLFDTAQLKDLYRVFSLFGLGVTLMVLAFLYQKFVFRER